MILGADQIFELIQLGINVLGAFLKGNPTALEQAILDLTLAGHKAYQLQAGKPIDPTLLQPIDPLP